MKFSLLVCSVLMMKAVRTSETSVNFKMTTRRYILEDSKLHTQLSKQLMKLIYQPTMLLGLSVG
jgi:hypothetical protein